MIGLTRDSSRSHIARAALEGIALSVATWWSSLKPPLGHGLGELAVDGGAAASDPLLQAQADSTGLIVRRAANLESTARGVALFAGVQAGVVSDIEDLVNRRQAMAPSLFEPQIDTPTRSAWRSRWNDAVTRSLGWHV